MAEKGINKESQTQSRDKRVFSRPFSSLFAINIDVIDKKLSRFVLHVAASRAEREDGLKASKTPDESGALIARERGKPAFRLRRSECVVSTVPLAIGRPSQR